MRPFTDEEEDEYEKTRRRASRRLCSCMDRGSLCGMERVRPLHQSGRQLTDSGRGVSDPTGQRRTRSGHVPCWALQLEPLRVMDRSGTGDGGPGRRLEVLLRDVLDL